MSYKCGVFVNHNYKIIFIRNRKAASTTVLDTFKVSSALQSAYGVPWLGGGLVGSLHEETEGIAIEWCCAAAVQVIAASQGLCKAAAPNLMPRQPCAPTCYLGAYATAPGGVQVAVQAALHAAVRRRGDGVARCEP